VVFVQDGVGAAAAASNHINSAPSTGLNPPDPLIFDTSVSQLHDKCELYIHTLPFKGWGATKKSLYTPPPPPPHTHTAGILACATKVLI